MSSAKPAAGASLMAMVETTFPSLDTSFQARRVTPYEEGEDDDPLCSTSREATCISVSSDTVTLEAIQRVFACFVADFTGLDEISFYSSRNDQPQKMLSAKWEDDATEETRVLRLSEVTCAQSDVKVDFHIAVIDESQSPIWISRRPLVGLIQVRDHKIVNIGMSCSKALLVNTDENHILTSLIKDFAIDVDICARLDPVHEWTRQISILNHPPAQRPLPLLQDAGRSVPSTSFLHAAFERRASDCPDTPAIDFLEAYMPNGQLSVRKSFTYGHLDYITTKLAQRILSSPNVRPHSVVPVLFTTSPELYISYLAILKAGLAFCPLPLDAPSSRLEAIIMDVEPSVVLGSQATRENFLDIDKIFESEDRVWIDVGSFVSEMREDDVLQTEEFCKAAEVSESDVAYVMYTSGSTGKPKGVQITHLAATCSITAHAMTSPLPSAKDGPPRWFQFAAPTFDPSLMEIFVTLSTGATLCATTREIMLTDVESAVTTLEATVMMATPSMAALLRRPKLPTLRSLWTMGELLLRKNIDDFSQQYEDIPSQLVNAYGPTEASINCTLLPDFHIGDRGSIIGSELPTCSLFIIDPSTRTPIPVPRGFAGELAIGGPQVSIGYIKRPVENAKAFVESHEFGRLYRTGDKARLVTDRNGRLVVEFLGRIDTSQVKMSGRRVDLGEIDAVIATVPGVKETVTVAHKRSSNVSGGEEAVTFVVKDNVEEVELERMCRETASKHLPRFMCPAHYLFVPYIARSINGKVDRRTLSASVHDCLASRDSPTAASHVVEGEAIDTQASKTETIIRTILADVVGTETSSILASTSLFAVGVDSLRAIQFLQQARDAGVTGLSIADVLKSATPRAITALVLARQERVDSSDLADQRHSSAQLELLSRFRDKYLENASETFEFPRDDVQNVLPATATQSGMLASFLRNSQSAHKHYIHHSIHHVHPTIDIEKLQRRWLGVLQKHDAYRTVFSQVDDDLAPFMQIVLRPGSKAALQEWRTVSLDGHDQRAIDQAIAEALSHAESTIEISSPSYSLTSIVGPDSTIITFSIFHGIFDGASLQLLFEEVEAAYDDQSAPTRTELEIAVSQHFSASGENTIRYWQDLLVDCKPEPFPCLTGLRTETFRSQPVATTISSTISIDLLREAARRSAASPLAILQAAWALLLSTYKGSQECSTFGSVISGRLGSETAICVGPTFTTIPVFVPASLVESIDHPASNIQVLQWLTSQNANSLEHLQIPLNSVITADRGLHYDTLLAFQDFATSTRTSTLWSEVEYPAMGNDFSVMIEIWPEYLGDMNLRATYTNHHLDEPAAVLMLKQFDEIVQFIISNPNSPYLHGKYTSIVPDAVESTTSTTAASTPEEELLHTAFETNATQNPDDIALIFQHSLETIDKNTATRWSYSELNNKANDLAQYLTTRFGPMNRLVVPFSLHKSPQLYIAILAILKAGAAWCPIDPAFPPQRRHDLIARTDARLLLVAGLKAQEDTQGVPNDVEIVNIDDAIKEFEPFDSAILLSPDPNDMAYLIWTSGTTGAPKGVQVSHIAAAQAMRSLQTTIATSKEGDVRCLQFSQPTFDVFVQDLFYTWGLRGTLISASKDIMLGSFAALANLTEATHAHLTPAFATIVPRQTCRTLQVVTMIGESLPQAVADDWSNDIYAAYNTYGPAEAAVVSTVKQFGGCDNEFKSANIGLPLPSLKACVVNNVRPIIRNGVGELVLSGSQLANGYWKDDAKTSEKFFENEFIGGHVYMTGDIVRQLHDGSFEFVGRQDDLIKIAGQRVELSEISFAMQGACPAVEQIVTIYTSRPNRPAKAVVVFASAPKLASDDHVAEVPLVGNEAASVANALHAKAAQSLPEHMLPSVVVILSEIPVTASAKIDRNSLQRSYNSINLDSWEISTAKTQPSDWSDDEAKLLEHISRFSGVPIDAISRSSRLAALGIDSIGVIRFTACLKDLGYSVSMAALLQCRTFADLCSAIHSNVEHKPSDGASQYLQAFDDHWRSPVATHLGLHANDLASVVPTLPLQDNLLSESMKHHASYWSNHFFKLSDQIDLGRLRHAWTETAQKTEALRTGFLARGAIRNDHATANVKSVFLQVIYSSPIINWSYIPPVSQDIQHTARERAQQITLEHHKDIFRQPCWAVTILQSDSGEPTMMFSVHHAIHDGPSLGFILADVYAAYMSELDVSHVRHQLSHAVGMISSSRKADVETEAFWENALKDYAVEEHEISDDLSSKKQPIYHESRHHLSLSHETLRAFAQHHECSSMASVTRVAWGCIVADLLEADEKRILMGEVLSERITDSSLEDTIGPLVCLVPIPFRAYGTTAQLLSQNKEFMNTSWPHRHVNPGFVRKLINRPRNQALYEAMFVFHPYDSQRDVKNDMWSETQDHIGLTVEHDLILNVEEASDGTLELVGAANTNTLSRAGLDLLVRQVDALVTAMSSNPELPVMELSNHLPCELLSITQQCELRLDPIVELSNPLCWLEHWAKVAPTWPAVEIAQHIEHGQTKTVKWSYAELAERANRVSTFIQSQNVRNRIIGVCLGRTLISFAVIVGIFKSGNTYLPIEEDLPKERKVFLLEDSNAPICFTADTIRDTTNACQMVLITDDTNFVDSAARSESQTLGRSSQDPAYLLYTSGSTGNPKGVLVSCGNLTSFCEAQSEFICACVPETLSLGGKGKYLALASRAFDVHVAEMFLAWRWGLTCVTALKSMLLDDLSLALRELKVTHASFVPSLLDQVGLVPEDVPLLKYMGVGGEKISQRTLETWGDSMSVALINAYGPTEVTIGCASAMVNSKSNLRNIGRPLGDLVAHVLIPGTLNYAKRGMEGELCFTGSLVAIGYHNRQLPAFVADFRGQKMYRTGDLVRLMPDDTIEIFGRADDQTKIRGQRLELGEVSSCVQSLSKDFESVATIITKHPSLSRQQLVTFVAFTKRSKTAEECVILESHQDVNITVRSGCKERLPGYMVPDVVVPINFLPIAPNSGKADVKQLKALFAKLSLQTLVSGDKTSNLHQEEPSRALNSGEERLLTVLAKVVKFDPATIKPTTNIFELGVDSLVVISLSAHLRKLGYHCSVADIMSISTIAELALLMTESPVLFSDTDAEVAKDVCTSTEAQAQFGDSKLSIRPTMPLQEAMVAKSLNDETGALYVNHIVLDLAAHLDPGKLHAAWISSSQGNDILRTCFKQLKDEIVQVVLDPTTYQLNWTNTIYDEDVYAVQLLDLQTQVAKHIVGHIQSIPPIRINLLISNATNVKRYLCLSMHHALYDAQSLTMLLEDITMRYNQLQLPVRPTSDILVRYLQTQDRSKAQEYWTKTLDGYVFPEIIEEKAVGDKSACTVTRTVNKPLSMLESQASQRKVTLPIIAQLAYGLATAKTHNINDLVFGLVLSGRTVPVLNIETLLALTITTIPQRIDLRRPDSTIFELLSTLQKSSGQVLQFQHTSLRSIHQWVQADRPLFDSLLSYIKTGAEQPVNKLWTEVESYMPPDYPFAMEFHANTEANQLILTATSTAVDTGEKEVANLLEMIETLLVNITDGEDMSLSDLGITSINNTGSTQTTNDQLHGEPEQWSETETQILQTIADLEIVNGDIGRMRGFFRMGIDSVVAIRLASNLRKVGLKVSSSDILRHPSIAALASHIQSAKPAIPMSQDMEQHHLSLADPEIAGLFDDANAISQVYRCTPLQAGLLTQTIASGGNTYIHHPSVVLDHRIDLARLKEAWTSVVTIHDILHTSFHLTETSSSWIGAVRKNISPYWLEMDVDNNIEHILADFVKATTFSTEKSFATPPLRVTIIKANSSRIMVVSLHHSLYDGWALPLIFQALEAAYVQLACTPPIPFFEAARLINANQSDSEQYWIDHIANYPGLNIPPEAIAQDRTTCFANITISMSASTILEKCRALGTTLHAISLLTFAKVLASLLGRKDVLFGRVVSGRILPLPAVESIVGPLFNTIPCRITLDNPLASNQSSIEQIQQLILEQQAHEHASLAHIQKAWRKLHSELDKTLFDALFVFQKAPAEFEAGFSPLWRPLEVSDDRDATEYGLNAECVQAKDHVVFSVSSSGQLSAVDLQILCNHFDTAFRDILEFPTRGVTGYIDSIQDLPLLYQPSAMSDTQQSTDVKNSSFYAIVREALATVAQVSPDSIHEDTSIYAVGIDSITVIKVAAQIRKQDINTSVADILQGRSLSGIVTRLIAKNKTKSSRIEDRTSVLPLETQEAIIAQSRYSKFEVEVVLPCLAGQVYHLASWLSTGRTSYEPTWPFFANLRLDPQRLAKAWANLQIRQSILRTIFVLHAKTPYQIVLTPHTVQIGQYFEVLETTEDLVDKVKERVTNLSASPSDVFTPAIKLCLVRGAKQDVVLLKLHHSLYDAWTMTTLVNELAALYSDQTLEPLSNFSDCVSQIHSSTTSTSSTDFWKKTLQNAQSTHLFPASILQANPSRNSGIFSRLPSIFKSSANTPSKEIEPRPHAQTFIWLKQGVLGIKHLNQLCRKNDLSLSTLVILAFARVLSRATSTSSPTFGFFQTGRSSDIPGLATMPGPCVNLLPMSVDVSSETADLNVARSIQGHLRERIPFEQSHLQRVLQTIQKPEKTLKSLFNASLNLLWQTDDISATDASSEQPLFSHMPIGVPSDFASQYPIEGVTAVDGLETGYLAEQNLFCDVGPVAETDSLDFGVKCDASLMGEVELRDFVQEICAEINRIVYDLPGPE